MSFNIFKSLSIVLGLSFSLSSVALANETFMEATKDLRESRIAEPVEEYKNWIKLTCFGPVTPIGINPMVEAEVTSFHFPVPAGKPVPSLKDIQEQDRTRMDNFARLCTVRRYQQTDLTGFTGLWLDWGTAYYDSKLLKRVVVIEDDLCREIGFPCQSTSQCCNGNNRGMESTDQLTCNVMTNTCERGGSQE
jgi:hypothetical protein